MRWHTPACVIQALPRSDAAALEKLPPSVLEPLVGFTASKRLGKAVARNRAKRRLRAAMAAIIPQLAADHLAFVLIAKAPVLSQPYAALTADLLKALRILGRKYAA